MMSEEADATEKVPLVDGEGSEEETVDLQDELPPESGQIGDGAMDETVKKLEQGKELLMKAKAGTKSWRQFFSCARLSKPKSCGDWGGRVVGNIKNYKSNYIFVFLGLVIYCIITSPVLLIGLLLVMFALWFIFRNEGKSISIAGKEIGLKEQVGLVCLMALPLFLFGGATSAIFWIIGASVCAILLHASFMSLESPDPADAFGVEMESVVVN
eukprot:m.307166 g.307166  ORF g.307166 m.307166 type:complete len:213 (+) comp41976_c0_seq1:3-641(+)